MASNRCDEIYPSAAEVSVKPAAAALKQIPCGPTSRASERVKPITPLPPVTMATFVAKDISRFSPLTAPNKLGERLRSPATVRAFR